ncbi:MAG TPA: YigZ family protein [Firmicutes bacterium]|nr:YigZ family protein [Bacillota bacterium]
MTDAFWTVAGETRVKIPVGACRFIASVARTDTEAEAKAFIARVSAEFHDATHNAFAYKIGLGDAAIIRHNDAAEPQGTAGQPMLQAIEKAGLTNVTVVGTRYFGGVKLGIGGLIRAYRSCAEAGLNAAGRVEEILREKVVVEIAYELLGTVLHELAACRAEVTAVNYTAEGARVTALVPAASLQSLQVQLQESTSGKAVLYFGHTNGISLQGGE